MSSNRRSVASGLGVSRRGFAPTLREMKRPDTVRLGIVAFKFCTGAVELVAGLMLAIVPPEVLRAVVDFLVRAELREDSRDPAIAFIQNHLAGFLSEHKGVGIGLFVLGTIKIVGAIGLLRRKPWGYYLLVIALILFLPIEGVHLAQSYSNSGLVVTVADCVVLALLLGFRKTLTAHGKPRS
jgi:uncharacterized membrane protein